eukprot:CAMPEP_0175763072 /NCGR_PEP_ID=MMETSP0097-20121207/67548_1 /TAXON_ID=311494 /ORGANISM="Alexandrium monilatum, Strain CCMP3105" /LENGTH=260 /DNA_ID=CAMNT_0017072789 /DNA_START=66 /DNA_END=846 /DNA_ORIENTATION=+
MAGLDELPCGEALEAVEALLRFEHRFKDIVDWQTLPRILSDARLALWKGDVASLRIGAVVNAANEQGLGCFQPHHRCIDNIIHCGAGPALRRACAEEMERCGLGQRLPTGEAICTPGFCSTVLARIITLVQFCPCAAFASPRTSDPHARAGRGEARAPGEVLPERAGLLPGTGHPDGVPLLHLHGPLRVPRGQGCGAGSHHGQELAGRKGHRGRLHRSPRPCGLRCLAGVRPADLPEAIGRGVIAGPRAVAGSPQLTGFL